MGTRYGGETCNSTTFFNFFCEHTSKGFPESHQNCFTLKKRFEVSLSFIFL